MGRIGNVGGAGSTQEPLMPEEGIPKNLGNEESVAKKIASVSPRVLGGEETTTMRPAPRPTGTGGPSNFTEEQVQQSITSAKTEITTRSRRASLVEEPMETAKSAIKTLKEALGRISLQIRTTWMSSKEWVETRRRASSVTAKSTFSETPVLSEEERILESVEGVKISRTPEGNPQIDFDGTKTPEAIGKDLHQEQYLALVMLTLSEQTFATVNEALNAANSFDEKNLPSDDAINTLLALQSLQKQMRPLKQLAEARSGRELSWPQQIADNLDVAVHALETMLESSSGVKEEHSYEDAVTISTSLLGKIITANKTERGNLVKNLAAAIHNRDVETFSHVDFGAIQNKKAFESAKKDLDNPLGALPHRFNTISHTFIIAILEQENKSDVPKAMALAAHLAETLVEQGDLFGAQAIYSALTNSAIDRIRNRVKLSEDANQAFERLTELFNTKGAYKQLRNEEEKWVSSKLKGYVPSIGFHLSDIQFIFDGNLDDNRNLTDEGKELLEEKVGYLRDLQTLGQQKSFTPSTGFYSILREFSESMAITENVVQKETTKKFENQLYDRSVERFSRK